MGVQERRAREKKELRGEILDAARDLFLREGYENVSMRKIAEKIEYSPTTIYLYFQDKADLLDCIKNATGPHRRLIAQRRVLAYPYKGYWSPADTVKERAQLEEMYQQGNCPWMVWDPERSGANKAATEGAAHEVAATAAAATVAR